MVGRAAMSFTAILFLHATPLQMGILNAMELAPGFSGWPCLPGPGWTGCAAAPC